MARRKRKISDYSFFTLSSDLNDNRTGNNNGQVVTGTGFSKELITKNENITIPINCQMLVAEQITVEGTLTIDGNLAIV